VEVTVLNRQRTRRVHPRSLASFVKALAERMPPARADRVAVCLVSDRRMREYDLYAEDVGVERLKVDPIAPEDGYTGGYTNGRQKAVNGYGIPGTRFAWTFPCRFA